MISREDCLALCGLSIDEILALAEREHIPTMAAVGLGAHLLCQKDGCRTIRQMIIDDIDEAQARGDTGHVAELKRTLKTFLSEHPAPGPQVALQHRVNIWFAELQFLNRSDESSVAQGKATGRIVTQVFVSPAAIW